MKGREIGLRVGQGAVLLVLWLALVWPAGGHSVQAQTTREPKQVYFRVRINNTTLDWFNDVARPIDMGSLHSRDVAMLGQLSRGVKQILFTSAAEAERIVPTVAHQITDIAYDLEHWPQTPVDEQIDPMSAVKRLRTLVDEYGLELTLAPDRRFTQQYAVQMAPYADSYILQVQRLQSSPAALLAFARPLIDGMREANPDIKIVIQLRTEGSTDDMLSLVAALYDDIDGISVLTNPTSLYLAREFVERLHEGEQAILAVGTPRPAISGPESATPEIDATPSGGTPEAISSLPTATATDRAPRPTRTPVPHVRASRRAEVRATRLAQLTQAPLDATPTPRGDTPWPLADLAATETPRPTDEGRPVLGDEPPVLEIALGGVAVVLVAGSLLLFWAYRRTMQ